MNNFKPNSVQNTGAKFNNSELKLQWETFDWSKANETVNRLQSRIAKAVINNNINLAKKLGHLLVNNHYAKALAVKRVVSNKGKNTPGVDGVIWDRPELKMKAIYELNNRTYKAKPLRRVFIKKSNGKERPLGIPTMYDRAMQALYAIALEPIAETKGDRHSFGFRKYRSAADAREQIFSALCKRTSAKWILEGDIKGCFDNINHDWLLKNIPMDSKILNQFLKAGFIYESVFHDATDGTPQGGIISPILANMTLDGIDELLDKKYWSNSKGSISVKYNKHKVNFIRYADDFIITADTEEIAKEIKEEIKSFLNVRGLELSDEKTLITKVEDGFDFLGWNFRTYKGKLLIKPSKKSIQNICKNTRNLIAKNKATTQEDLIKKLNPIIRGWGNYHQGAVSKDIYSDVDNAIHQALWNWANRRHGKQSKKRTKNKYWQTINGRQWVFTCNDTRLIKLSDIRIVRHPKLKIEMNPFIKEGQTYFEERRFKIGASKISGRFKKLWIRQKGLCILCGNPMDATEKKLIKITTRFDDDDDKLAGMAYSHLTCNTTAANK
ncbi:MAG: group II intron reverse transcriptase/maturase [Sarcina sp.]